MSFFFTAALFFLASLLFTPINACLDEGCVDAEVGLGVAAHAGIAIAVIVVVGLVLFLLIRQRRLRQMQAAQANGTKPYDIEQGNIPTSEVNASQSTLDTQTYDKKGFTEVKDYTIQVYLTQAAPTYNVYELYLYIPVEGLYPRSSCYCYQWSTTRKRQEHSGTGNVDTANADPLFHSGGIHKSSDEFEREKKNMEND
ncbi:hypothetical protein K439DRAFT_1621522 [Ramaria rubella]|nr:hypothetical protein K439DRAFT_1621522 [Ramaria rubella]